MTTNIICIHQGEDGVVCGLAVWTRVGEPQHHEGPLGFGCGALGCHPFTPGRKCPTCDGYGWVMRVRPRAVHPNDCPTCATSPVRGYQKL